MCCIFVAAVLKDDCVLAPGVLEGIGEDRHGRVVPRRKHLGRRASALPVSVRHAGSKVTVESVLQKMHRNRCACARFSALHSLRQSGLSDTAASGDAHHLGGFEGVRTW